VTELRNAEPAPAALVLARLTGEGFTPKGKVVFFPHSSSRRRRKQREQEVVAAGKERFGEDQCRFCEQFRFRYREDVIQSTKYVHANVPIKYVLSYVLDDVPWDHDPLQIFSGLRFCQFSGDRCYDKRAGEEGSYV